jgi:hypothetical protein
MAPAGSDGATARRVDRRRFQAALWLVALLITGVAAGYQRRTGPTWPVSVVVELPGAHVSGELPRSHGGPGAAFITLLAPDSAVGGQLLWRRYPTDDPWSAAPLLRLEDWLAAALPHQDPAGKLEYQVRLSHGGQVVVVPAANSAIIRFRGDVPGLILLPHIMCMFLGLVIGARAFLGTVFNEQAPQRHIPWLLFFLVPGGLVLGPLVQKFAFGAYWTGWPVGEDLTDTKTFVMVFVWIVAWIVSRRLGERRPSLRRGAILAAAVIMLVVYLIPHSTHGSQINWSKSPPVTRTRS